MVNTSSKLEIRDGPRHKLKKRGAFRCVLFNELLSIEQKNLSV